MNAIFEKILNILVTAICALVFFVGFTVVGFVTRLFSKLCRMNINKSVVTYWRIIRATGKDE